MLRKQLIVTLVRLYLDVRRQWDRTTSLEPGCDVICLEICEDVPLFYIAAYKLIAGEKGLSDWFSLMLLEIWFSTIIIKL